MNGQGIQKGTVSSVEGKTDRNGDKTCARVLPCTAGGMVTQPLAIPWWLRGKMGNLAPGVQVAYAVFEDGGGILLARMDGEWEGTVPGDVTIIKGGIGIPEGDVTAGGIRLTSHTHSGVHGETGGPH